MKAQLLVSTPEPLRLMYAQTRGTTTSKGFAAVYNDPVAFFPKALRQDPTYDPAIHHKVTTGEMIRLVDDAVFANHLSVTRGVKFTFAFEVSRSAGRQMLRHVIDFAWEEMSQRYVKLLNADYERELEELCRGADERALREHLERAFVIPDAITGAEIWLWARVRLAEVREYLSEIRYGIAPEDARENLPNCTKTQMIATIGFEALKNFLGKRLCTRAQEPVRDIAKQMRKQITAMHPWMGKHLTVHCLPHRICPESRPDGCALLLENGGNVLRRSQAAEAIAAYAKEYRCGSSPSATPTPSTAS